MGIKKVAFQTLGCRLNYSETSSIARTFVDNGYELVEFNAPASVYVINTCSVTENADKECRMLVRNVLKQQPDAFIAIIGCYAQLKPDEIASIDGVDLVLGASEKFKLLNYLNDLQKREHAEIHSCETQTITNFESAFSLNNRTRTFLKVQDGCDYGCTYCTIPLARGKSRSDTIENVLQNVEKIALEGVKEIVLTGINLGDYSTETSNGKANFYSLIQQLETVDTIERFRISSIEPNLLDEEIIRFVSQSKKFVPHFHIPLQSGSNRILKLMRRRYQKELYQEKIALIRQLMPFCCIGADVIVGFPGESDIEFEETMKFLSDLDISYLHVFTYSERANTLAPNFEGSVSVQIRRKRNKQLRILSEKKSHSFNLLNKGRTLPVLFEQESKDGFMYGYTNNFIKVRTPFKEAFVNQVIPITLDKIDSDGTYLYEPTASDIISDQSLNRLNYVS